MNLHLSDHASKRAQQRGISRQTINLLERYGDYRRRAPGGALALSLTMKAQQHWIREGIPASDLARTQGVVLIIDPSTGTVITVEHGYRRRFRH